MNDARPESPVYHQISETKGDERATNGSNVYDVGLEWVVLIRSGGRKGRYAVSTSLHDAVREKNNARESLQDRVSAHSLTNGHEGVFNARNIDSHDLRNEVKNLVVLGNY